MSQDGDEDEPAVAELLQPGQKALLVVGGRGGRGNHSFKTRLNTAPTIAEKGEAGLEEWLDLELKVGVRESVREGVREGGGCVRERGRGIGMCLCVEGMAVQTDGEVDRGRRSR